MLSVEATARKLSAAGLARVELVLDQLLTPPYSSDSMRKGCATTSHSVRRQAVLSSQAAYKSPSCVIDVC